jgi:hypothetical protein
MKLDVIAPRFLGAALLCFFTSTSVNAGTCNIVDGKGYGDCSNVTINNSIPENISVRSYKQLSGNYETVIVYKGGHLSLSGTASLVRIQPGGKADITGIASVVVNNGGVLSITGHVDLLSANKGTTEIEGIVDGISGSGKIVRRRGSVILGVPTP